MICQLFCEESGNNDFQILYEDKMFVSHFQLTQTGKDFVSGIQMSLLKECGLEFIYSVIFELKFKPKPVQENTE